MIAQFYTDHEPVVRLFDGIQVLADLSVPRSGLFNPRPRRDILAADIALKRNNLIRKSLWKKCEWGYEARVYFKKERLYDHR